VAARLVLRRVIAWKRLAHSTMTALIISCGRVGCASMLELESAYVSVDACCDQSGMS